MHYQTVHWAKQHYSTPSIRLLRALHRDLNLGKIVGDAIKRRLGLSDDTFQLNIRYADADSLVPGFQGTAIVELDLQKSITKTFEFDFSLPDLGPLTVDSGAELNVTVDANVNLDFGFRLDSFTAYLMDTTQVSLSTSIDSGIDVSAGIGGIRGDLVGQLQLRGTTTQSVNIGVSSVVLNEVPIGGVVVVTRDATCYAAEMHWMSQT